MRGRTEGGLKDGLACRSGERTPLRFKSYENCVNFFENLGFIELHCPAMLRCVIVVEYPETVSHMPRKFFAVASPSRIHEFAISGILRRQIERVKDQRLPLGVERPPKCL